MNNTEICTEDAQNRVARLLAGIDLNVDSPTIKLKRQYMKALAALNKARDELDILNDMKPKV